MAAPPKPTYSGRSFAAAPPLPGARTETTQSFGAASAAQSVQVQGGRARTATASGTVSLSRLTPGGAVGSLTFVNGLLTSFVSPT